MCNNCKRDTNYSQSLKLFSAHEQMPDQLHESQVVSKIGQLLNAPKDKEELHLAVRNEKTFTAGDLLRLVSKKLLYHMKC